MAKKSPFPEDLRFRYPWRPYQKRVLDELDIHLDDNRLHVVAAPGAGKTVLGLEVVRRLDEPTLIFSPTITIRNQWLARLETLFLPEPQNGRDWISTDVTKPKAVTSITYQALHAAVTGEEEPEEEEAGENDEDEGNEDSLEEENDERERRKQPRPRGGRRRSDVVSILKRARIGTVVLDECHHLRSEWWRVLIKTLDELEDITVVSLTATPPYDVAPAEWQRYQYLCGPVDAEISVPELVWEKNLCPHQDYLYLSSPSSEEKKQLKAFRAGVRAAVEGYLTDEELVEAVRTHPYLKKPKKHVREILDNVEFFSSISIYLYHATGKAPRKLLKVMGLHRERIPKMTLEWWETFLTGCLYGDRESFREVEETFQRIERELKRLGTIERRKVRLKSTRAIDRLLASSLSKIAGIREIVGLEHEALGDDLRQVILTDYIRAADMPRSPGDEKPLRRIGVVPIFETLRRDGPDGIRLGILSGSLVVIPKDALPVLRECCLVLGIRPEQVSSVPLAHDGGFLRVRIAGADRKRIVRVVTETFSRGEITVLVGTKSLLGEGWDAPSVNALVLASFVGSFMLSNQMRGRAIRVQTGLPDKTANIWHLACVEDERGPFGEPQPGSDWETMTRRFRSFMGPSRAEPIIESGIERLALGDPPFPERRIDQANTTTIEEALDRPGMTEKWLEALESGEGYRMVHELETSPEPLPRGFVFVDAIKLAIVQGLLAAGLIVGNTRVRLEGAPSLHTIFLVLIVLSGVGFLAALPFFLKAAWLALRHGSVSGSLRQIGKALLRSLVKSNAIDTDLRKMRVVTTKGGQYETAICRLEGATTFEKSLFLDALAELLGPIENPRYLLVRKSRFWSLRRSDYHAVPTILGRNKESAEYFARMWAKYVGPMELIYTRSTEGRELLLKARGRSLSATFLKRAERRNRWR